MCIRILIFVCIAGTLSAFSVSSSAQQDRVVTTYEYSYRFTTAGNTVLGMASFMYTDQSGSRFELYQGQTEHTVSFEASRNDYGFHVLVSIENGKFVLSFPDGPMYLWHAVSIGNIRSSAFFPVHNHPYIPGAYMNTYVGASSEGHEFLEVWIVPGLRRSCKTVVDIDSRIFSQECTIGASTYELRRIL